MNTTTIQQNNPSTKPRQLHSANAALYRTVIVRMRFHQPTIDYVARRTTEGLSKKDIIRCLRRFLTREIYKRVMTDHHLHTPKLDL